MPFAGAWTVLRHCLTYEFYNNKIIESRCYAMKLSHVKDANTKIQLNLRLRCSCFLMIMSKKSLKHKIHSAELRYVQFDGVIVGQSINHFGVPHNLVIRESINCKNLIVFLYCNFVTKFQSYISNT